MDDLSPFQRLENSRTNKFSIQHWPCASSLGLEIEAVCPMGFRQVTRWPVGPGPLTKVGSEAWFFPAFRGDKCKKIYIDLTVELSDLYLRIPWWFFDIFGSLKSLVIAMKKSQTERAAAAAKPHFECQPAEPKEPKGGWRFRWRKADDVNRQPFWGVTI